jgi:ubiquitin carboxyl-terminal hydrolase 7
VTFVSKEKLAELLTAIIRKDILWLILTIRVLMMCYYCVLQKYPIEQIRPWPFSYRSNQTCRPTLIDLETDLHKPIQDVSENQNPWNVFVEVVAPDSGLQTLPPFDKDTDVLLFFKFYDPKTKRIHYCGHHYMPVAAKVRKYQHT